MWRPVCRHPRRMTPGTWRVLSLHVGGIASATHVELGIFFLIGLLGGAHCLGMCGPLVTMYSERMQPSSRDDMLILFEVRQHALFNLGRTGSYAVLGGAFGLVGALVFETSSIVTTVGTVVRATTGVIVGIAILVVGIRYLLGHHGGEDSLGADRSPPCTTDSPRASTSGQPARGSSASASCTDSFPVRYSIPPTYTRSRMARRSVGDLRCWCSDWGPSRRCFSMGRSSRQSRPHTARNSIALGIAFLVMGWMPLAHGLELFGIHVPYVQPPIYQPLTP